MGGAVCEEGMIPLQGVPQYVSVRADRRDAPLLLYLHGGPGDAALPLVRKYNRALERDFTVAVWEQRGTGKSYYPFGGGERVTIEVFLEDLLALTRYLLERFHQEKLYLVGHSWGSVLGLRFLQRHPELVRAYVGCGQVVHMKESCRRAYDFACAGASGKTLEKLRGIDCAYTGEHWLDDLLFVTGQVVKQGGSLYGKRSYNSLVAPFLFSGQYGLKDLMGRQKGSLQSLQRLWPELMETDFEDVRAYGAPVIFVEGRYDAHVSSALAWEYYETIRTEKRFFWFEASCHFPQWSESGRFNELMAEVLR
ncbi:alpha/beta hydrolase [Oscillospiraceae bacterium]|nr:alpha/beta hydrolase [Oscillospiraceae bacterium]